MPAGARCRATFVADGNAQEVSVEVRSGATTEPIGGLFWKRPISSCPAGETNPAALAALADECLRATPEQ